MQGEEVLKTLKENPKTKNIPIVVLTASDDDPMRDTCTKLGADETITKPITPDGFLKVIEHLKKYWS